MITVNQEACAMPVAGNRIARLLLAAAFVALAACASGSPPITPSAGEGSAEPPPSGSVATPVSDPTGGAPSASPLPGVPSGALTTDTLGPATGVAGSWTLDGTGTDAPWLPASALEPIQLAPGGELTVAYEDGAAIGPWGAWIASADDPRGESATWIGGRETADPALAAVSLSDVPSGRWVLAVRLDRADGRGDATFYWLLVAG